MGTAYEWGAMASLPTVTLANHTSILTGRFPGHHGILHNAWYDRARGEQVITNSRPRGRGRCSHLVDGRRDAARADPPRAAPTRSPRRSTSRATSAPTTPPSSSSATATCPPIPEGPEGMPHTTERFVRPSKDYAWSTIVDHLGVEQAVSIWAGEYRDQ